MEAKRLCSFHMRTALYVLLAVAAPVFAGQTVYKWVDDKGVTHFSDQPMPGATKVEMSSSSNRSTSTPAPTPSSPATSTPEPTKRGPAYSRFVVASPQQDEAIINTGGKVSVSLAATPALSSDHVVTLFLDGGKVADFPPNSLAYDFSGMPRGTHTVKGVVSTKEGQQLQETPPVTFHVRQESIAKPPTGPNVRPNRPRTSAGNKMYTSQPSYSALNGSRAAIDPTTNMPVKTKPASNGPKN